MDTYLRHLENHAFSQASLMQGTPLQAWGSHICGNDGRCQTNSRDHNLIFNRVNFFAVVPPPSGQVLVGLALRVTSNLKNLNIQHCL